MSHHASAETTEFSFLPGQAKALGVPVPAIERISIVLSDGRTLSALRIGEAPPEITFLHGAGLNAHTWDTTLLALGRPALAIDLAGHGDSSWRDDADYTGRTLAADVIEALHAWTDRPQVLVGQSLGGLTAVAVAARAPRLVLSVIVVDITPGVDQSGGPTALREFYRVVDAADRDELVDRAQRFGFGGDRDNTVRGVFLNTRVRPDGRVEWKHHFAHIASSLLDAPADAASAFSARTILGEAGWADLAVVRAPLTLVRADDGFVSEEALRVFEERVPAATVIRLEGRHNLQETSPVALAAVIRTTADTGSPGL
ncbi:alpha/beta hydrolase [Microbacterium capsulatum]|uniref:Alpha/beta hydrolase n=1 Tax=Microbacterium capsulatum TaxID=3041921 RepID=A0ABU0XB31_9MICO|nr:alpha/beta hydrolase [Microbacterium sp. ASV81]MDQ4212316.1 alpha/beta hydrolase [Microbacterium sp. ASV81]